MSVNVEMVLDQFWRCPKCGTNMAAGDPMRLHPPTCQMGHPPTEMEQTTAEGFGLPATPQNGESDE